MGFSFKPFKATTRALGIPDKVAAVIFPGARIAEDAANAAINYVGNKVLQPQGKGAATGMNIPYPGGNYTVYNQGYGTPPAYSVYFQEEGRNTPWDYSTGSYQTLPVMHSETLPQDLTSGGSWEERLANLYGNR